MGDGPTFGRFGVYEGRRVVSREDRNYGHRHGFEDTVGDFWGGIGRPPRHVRPARTNGLARIERD